MLGADVAKDGLEFDLIVIGAGMAGLSAAAWAAENGLRVVVVETSRTHGGSAVLSGGIVWTLQTGRKLAYHAEGDPHLCCLVSDTYAAAIEWLRRRGVAMSTAIDVLNGRGYQVDIIGHLTQCIISVEGTGGAVVYETEIETLLTDQYGRVSGVRTVHADGKANLYAPWTLIATGGFQASPELREEYLGENGKEAVLRSNPYSNGGGIRLAASVGARTTKGNTGFYGHLVSGSPDWGKPSLFTSLSQYHSDHAILMNELGLRFCDETEGDHANTHRTLREIGGRAIMVWDETVHQAHGVTSIVETVAPEDRMEIALTNGGRGIIAATLQEIGAFADCEGFSGAQVVSTILEYNELARSGWERLSPPRTQHEQRPLTNSPYYALIVYPAITFTFAGIAANADMQVLADDRPIDGLLVAGADTGDIFRTGYGGGLATALTTGLQAARTAVSALSQSGFKSPESR